MRISVIVPLLLVAVAGALLTRGPSLAVSSVTSVDIDTDITASPANTATSVGSTETCASISNGASLTIDIVMKSTIVANNPGVEGYEYVLNYNSSVLLITAADNKMFLDSASGSLVFDVTNPTPDGEFEVGVADFSISSEGGDGVLTRITVEAISPGTSALSLTGVNVVGDGQSLMNGASVGSAEVRVGSACGGPTATASPTASPTNAPTSSPTPTATAVAGATQTPSPSPTPTATATPPAATTTPAATHTPTPTEPLTVKGDGDCNTNVDAYDALIVLLNTANGTPLPCSLAADTNCDGMADLADVLVILYWLGGLPVTLPAGCPAIATA